jgi:hypothetical protein
MKKSLVILLIAVFMPLAFTYRAVAESAHGKPIMTKAVVVAIANDEARRQGYDLSKYEKPRVEYELTSQDETWTVFYEGKEKAPGNHFSVWVNDRTGKCRLMRGK